MQVGTSYYPELTPQMDWDRDLGLMAEAGLSVVRVFDFAWAAFEPRELEYDFAWAQRFLDLLTKHGLSAVLCTPSAAPPAWLIHQYPQIMIETREGQSLPFGGRRDVDVCSPIFRDYAVRIATAMGERFGQHPAVIGWQIDNELCGAEHLAPESHTPESTWRFRRWLQAKYGDLAALNKAWYMTFWSQAFSAWGEVTTPRCQRVTRGWAIDYSRFFSDMQAEFARLQYDALRPHLAEHQWINHNSTAMFDRGLNHADMARALDNAGWDAYLGAASAGHGYQEQFVCLANDWLRTATRQPVKVMETGIHDCTEEYLSLLARHGVDMVLFWHWRCHRGNLEAGGRTICDYAGEPYPESYALAKAAAAFGRQASAPDVSRRHAAMIFSVDCFRAHLHKGKGWKEGPPDYLDALIPTYAEAIERLGPIDVVEPGASLDGYRIVFAPSLRLLDESAAAVIRDYVESGGVLLASGKTAQVNGTAVYYERPGEPLAAVIGARLRVPGDHPRLEAATIQTHDGQSLATEGWVERWVEADGEVLGTFRGGEFDGLAALRHRSVGRGQAFLSATSDRNAIAYLMPQALAAARLPPTNSAASY